MRPRERIAGALRFAVCDTGIGIPEDARELIFAPYSQVDTSTTRKFGGTGLGLTISWRVVELMKGRIWTEGSVGTGSTFYFTARFAVSNKPHVAVASRPTDLSDVKTLIIDDNGTNRLILSEMLSRWGAVVTEAEGGQQGVAELLRAQRGRCALFPRVAGSSHAGRRRLRGRGGHPSAADDGGDDDLDAYVGEPGRGHCTRSCARGCRVPCETRQAGRAAGGHPGSARRRNPAAERPAAQARGIPAGPQSLRILLAEDSQDNVLLIEAYLKASGYTADVARNGQIALEKFISGKYDVVLMDVQMPIMDGYSAARRIRQWETENGATPVPILALTAHALPEEVRKSFDAGCTAHLTKPIRKATLLAAIEEHTMGLVRVVASLAELVPGFLEGRRRDIDAIAAALERSDYDDVRILGHNMKGSGAGYGFNRITEIGASLEQAAGRRAPEEIRTRSAELVRYLDGLHVVYE